jgi:imidazolonepropionase-like amidohydrolase
MIGFCSGRLPRPAILLFSACLALCACSPPSEHNLAITHVTILDMTAAGPRADQTIIIAKERIAAIGASDSVAIPRGAQILDAHEKFLVPGLVDMHIHLTAAGEPDGSRKFMLPLLLANGITTVRDMGGYLESIRPLQKEIAEGKRLGPRIFTPGPYLDGSPPSFQPSLVVTNPVEASEQVHRLVSLGVDFIKVQSMLSRESYFAIAQAALRERITFVGHVPDRLTAAEAVAAGQHSIEHLTNVLRGCSLQEPKLMREQLYVPLKQEAPEQSHSRIVAWQQELLDSYSPQKAAALIARFKEKNVWQAPTLVLLKSDAFPTLENSVVASDEGAKYIPARTIDIWKKARTEQVRTLSPQDAELYQRLLRKSMDIVVQMQKAGVKILAGTDAPAPYVFPGSGLHDELQLLVESGLTPREALQSATNSPAEFLHVAKDSGTIEEGKIADLVLLEANPLDDIRNTRKIQAVIVRGKLLDRTALNRLLTEEKSFVDSH